ncbi:MAG: formylglycine-generating enzyme family protein, partial [Anaerolineae bacterium]|nr:formylglycine-generating enzyme family protein [Anaerolineae bacterium]
LTPSDTPQPTVEPTPAPGTVRVDEKGISQVWVPAGCFMMGSDPAVDPDAQSNEQPQHEVCLTEGYWIDQYEVTNAAYQAFMEDGGYENPEWWSEAGWQWKEEYNISSPGCLENENYNASQQHVVCVSWYEAEAYARWRGGRLPTEAQWEYAARGTDGRIYPWGNEFDGTRLNFCDKNCPNDWSDESYDDGYVYTAPVGSYEAGKSWVGAYDMAGNVWEWVADWYSEDYYAGSPRENPAGPESSKTRVLRGGLWYNIQFNARAASRFNFYPSPRDDLGGFRVCGSALY